MSPFQNSHQPTHAGQPAGAFNSAPDEEPIASSFDGEGPPFDPAFLDMPRMEPPGLWNFEFASQSSLDFGLNGQVMLPPLNSKGPRFDYPLNSWTDETFGFGTGLASQGTLNGPAMVPPFDPNSWMDQPVGLLGSQVASQSALFPLGQAIAALDSAPFYLQDASFDRINAADWINDDAGMPDALDRSADPIR